MLIYIASPPGFLTPSSPLSNFAKSELFEYSVHPPEVLEESNRGAKSPIEIITFCHNINNLVYRFVCDFFQDTLWRIAKFKVTKVRFDIL